LVGSSKCEKRENDAASFLKQKSSEFNRKADSLEPVLPARSKELRELAEIIQNRSKRLESIAKRRWNRGFEHLGIFEDLAKQAVPVQERELDSWFQLRLATILRIFLQANEIPVKGHTGKRKRNISLRTIARLIVLFFVCADLAEPSIGEIKLKHGRSISLRNVLDLLRREGIK